MAIIMHPFLLVVPEPKTNAPHPYSTDSGLLEKSHISVSCITGFPKAGIQGDAVALHS